MDKNTFRSFVKTLASMTGKLDIESYLPEDVKPFDPVLAKKFENFQESFYNIVDYAKSRLEK